MLSILSASQQILNLDISKNDQHFYDSKTNISPPFQYFNEQFALRITIYEKNVQKTKQI